MFCREHIDRIIKDCFTTFGGSCLDTPVFERKDVLTDKYGEDAKLIFDLMDQGGEQLALRYDHTVPLARFLAMNGASAPQGKIWQVGKVYRRDNPVMSKGRMREFMQAVSPFFLFWVMKEIFITDFQQDFDITGQWDPMIPDAEILSLLSTILSRLDVGEFTIKVRYSVFVSFAISLTALDLPRLITVGFWTESLRSAGFPSKRFVASPLLSISWTR